MDEMLKDLADRLRWAAQELKGYADRRPYWDQDRLAGKADGVRLALSYVEELQRLVLDDI